MTAHRIRVVGGRITIDGNDVTDLVTAVGITVTGGVPSALVSFAPEATEIDVTATIGGLGGGSISAHMLRSFLDSVNADDLESRVARRATLGERISDAYRAELLALLDDRGTGESQ